MTTRLAAKIAGLEPVLPLKHVAAWCRVGWDTVKQIDQRALQRRLGRMEDQLKGLTQLAVDEFAIEKGRRYVTIVLDVVSKRVVWLVRGRGDDEIASFFTALGATRCAQITAGRCDLWGPVREAQRVIKGTRWLLLRNAAGLRRDERVRLRALHTANRALFVVYVLKDDFKQLWHSSLPRTRPESGHKRATLQSYSPFGHVIRTAYADLGDDVAPTMSLVNNTCPCNVSPRTVMRKTGPYKPLRHTICILVAVSNVQ